ncbi:uncharacterized protein LOC127813684 isoform X2 [Diospyros lotus]|uniref:uncharacterized protein LOC127813684 isoform X2 n=1 Tax=Diospyros lotus TaxID=55363 RepID=UPI002252AF87|nr:uncharacterized protein LOC127813684 isoform X2 [Diospyros lotus]
METSSRRSRGPVLPMASAFQRSISPTGRFRSSPQSDSSSFYASSTSSSFMSSHSNGFFHRSASPTRVNLHGFAPLAPSVRFSIDRSKSPSRSMVVASRDQVVRKHSRGPLSNLPKKTCMCSPTTHPGSFRCNLHKNCNSGQSVSYSPNRLNARRSAMANSLVRIGTVEGDLVKRTLAQLIRPSSHQQKRRADFQPRPSRLSIMSKASDSDLYNLPLQLWDFRFVCRPVPRHVFRIRRVLGAYVVVRILVYLCSNPQAQLFCRNDVLTFQGLLDRLNNSRT